MITGRKAVVQDLANSLDDEPVQTQTAVPNIMAALDAHLVGPKTHFNVSISGERSFATTSFALDQVKFVSRGLEATLNDTVLLMCSMALEQYLALHGNKPARSLIAAVPVSLRASGDMSASNQVTMLPVSLASNVTGTRQRLTAIQQSSGTVKAVTAVAKSSAGSLKLPTLGMPLLVKSLNAIYARSRIADVIPPIANLIISNVPGPQLPLYLAGMEVKTFYPLSIPVHGLGLNITLQSYNGRIDLGITAAKSAVPDAHKLIELLQESLATLAEGLSKPATEAPAAKAPTKKSAPKKPAVKKAAVKKVSKKTAAKKTSTKQVASKSVTVKKVAVKKTAVKKAAVKKSVAKKAVVKLAQRKRNN
jgi:diacylglycerol O-acyltransferase / wax synthase